MKKMIAVAVAMAFVVSGCSVNLNTGPDEVQTTQTVERVDEDAYVNQVTAMYPIGGQDALEAGYAACEIIGDQGVEALISGGLELNLDLEMLGFVAGSAVQYLCPQYKTVLESYLARQDQTVI